MSATDYFASAAWANGNRAHRLEGRVDDLEEALEDAESEILAWRRAYAEDIKDAMRDAKTITLGQRDVREIHVEGLGHLYTIESSPSPHNDLWVNVTVMTPGGRVLESEAHFIQDHD